MTGDVLTYALNTQLWIFLQEEKINHLVIGAEENPVLLHTLLIIF